MITEKYFMTVVLELPEYNYIGSSDYDDASENVRKQYFKERCLLIQKYFCAVYDYAGKADLSKGHWNPRKLGVTAHFSEIIKQQYF